MAARARIAIATGDPAGIGPEISLKAALDPVVRAACDPVLVSDPGVIARHAQACGIDVDIHAIERMADADFSGARLNVLDCHQPEAASARLRRDEPGRRPRVGRLRRHGGEGRACRRGRCGGRRAAQRDLHRPGRDQVRRPSLVRGARDRHARGRRLHDAVFRTDAHRPLHAAPERAQRHRRHHEGARAEGAARHLRHVEGPRHRRAAHRRQRHQSARRRGRTVRPRGNRDRQAGDGRGRRRGHRDGRPVRRRHHVPHEGL